ncbi:MAG: hypothetical protein ACXQTS_07870 [Candidatus Methanospirareceae archaeon]
MKGLPKDTKSKCKGKKKYEPPRIREVESLEEMMSSGGMGVEDLTFF